MKLQRPIGDENPVEKVTVVASEGTQHALGEDDSAALVEQQDMIFALTKSSLPFILQLQQRHQLVIK